MLENSTYGLNAIKNSTQNILSTVITSPISFDSDGKSSLSDGSSTTTTISGSGILLYYNININTSSVGSNEYNTVALKINIDNSVNYINSLAVGYTYEHDRQYIYLPFANKCTISPFLVNDGQQWYRTFGSYFIAYVLFS